MHIVVAILLSWFLATPAFSQSTAPVPIITGPLDQNTEIDAIHRRAVARMRRLGLDRRPPRALPRPILGYPLRLRPNTKAQRGDAVTNFVDLDPSANIKEFTCGSRSYDGHRGIDYVLWPFYWTMMDSREMEIVAAAPGQIASRNDGEFDRQCSAGSRPANHIVILQDDGVYAYYWHMKNGSVTSKPVGSRVEAGEYLGLVGSSGSSTAPHLHFELRTAGGTTIDPYAGACGDRNTSWKHQHEDVHTAVVRLATHRSEPNTGNSACGQGFAPNYADRFARGATVWIVAYLRDMRPDTAARFTVLKPDGTEFTSWTSGTPPSLYSATYVRGTIVLPSNAPLGQWIARVAFDGKTTEHTFIVGGRIRGTKIASIVRPLVATAAPHEPAKFRVTVRNTGSREAVGCTLAPDYPLAATSTYVVRGTPGRNAAFSIPPGARRVLTLTIKPKRRFRARQISVPIRVFCNNATAPQAKAGTNIVTLTF